MKEIFTILIIFLTFEQLFAQDLIVTKENDSINCKITKVKNNIVFFIRKHNTNFNNNLLSINQISSTKYNYYKDDAISTEKISLYNEFYPHWRLSGNKGYNYLIGIISNDVSYEFKQYVKELKKGTNYSIDLSYYMKNKFGVGFQYKLFHTFNEMDNIYIITSTGATKYGKMSDDITTVFIGPFFTTRLLSMNKLNAFVANIGIGFINYYDKKVVVDNYTITANTIGLSFGVGYDVGLSKNIAVGMQLAFTLGGLSEYQLKDGSSTQTVKLPSDSYESLNRIDLSLGLRLNSSK
ncbi:MAG: hypothetical protein A2X12_11530 [Bacteroidetes bacterium GWE2_29_8]|nr:MAG: hypothetical protein A2X12_11530 [Bacteroidetes bacterium GWE2_29_8]OFY13967.1 MAG: hypothetical protein A2X02_09100 [Bacteroidetes bacterium GWF2_29_10]